jgi:class 3 adenylate cyclase/tetratricopeptide (TPR) repeat protein
VAVDLACEAPFELGALQVRPALREAQLGSTIQSVEPRIMQVLVVLARNRGRVVSRQELIDHCWGGRIVVDNALNRCIAAIRRMSEACASFTITTVARVGYLLEECATANAEPVSPAPAGSKHERRHVTVLSCNLIRPAGITSRLDPEEWHAIIADYHRATVTAVDQFGGHVARGRADRVVAYFGFPRAREDAAERAVRAGLAIVARLREVNARAVHGIQLSVQVGIHAGVVVVGQSSAGDPEMFGEASDIASLVHAEAAADSVVITRAVHDVVAGIIAVDEHRALQLEGSDAPIQLYRAVSVLAHARGRGRPTRELTPFVGREEQTHLLMTRLNRACDAEGQLVLVSGEPGIGKSRLMAEFKARTDGCTHAWIECGGAALFANTPFYPIAEMLEEGLGWGDEDPVQRVRILEQALEDAGLRLSEAVPLIAEMLNLPIPERYPKLMFAPDQRRKRLFAAVLGWIFSAAREQPLVLVIEDLHWVDPSTLELIQMLAEQGATSQLLLVCTARPEFEPPWASRAHHAVVALNRLSNRETRELVGARVASAQLPLDAIDVVIQRSDGVPLFAEELTRLVLERNGRLGPREIPATLRDSLSARLDRLEHAKGVAQLSAVLGREFSYNLLRALSPMSDAELQSALTKLADADLIYERGMPPDANYQFRHTLIQAAAYEALLKSERRELHARVARTIVDKFPAVADAQPEVLARHWTDAGETENAIAAWTKAAKAARSRQAHREAEEGYRRALELLATLPDSPERDVREMELVSDLGSALQILRGEAAPEAVAALARCRALAEKGATITRQIAVLLQACSQAMVTGNIRDASLLAEQLLELAKRDGNAESLAMAHQSRFFTAFYLGDSLGAEKHFAIWRQLWELGGHGQAYRVRDGLCYASLRALVSGNFDLARERLEEAHAYARKTRDPFEIATTRIYGAFMHTQVAESESAEAAASEGLVATEKLDFSALAAIARVALGCAWSQSGRSRDGVALMRRGVAELIAVDYRLPVPGLLYLLAEGLMFDGAFEEALVTVNDALSFNPQEVAYRPQGLLIRGNLRFELGQSDLAATDFTDAIALSRTTGARLYELRAAMGFSRLLRARGDDQAARDVLAPICNWFSAGVEVLHVRQAKELLAELNTTRA